MNLYGGLLRDGVIFILKMSKIMGSSERSRQSKQVLICFHGIVDSQNIKNYTQCASATTETAVRSVYFKNYFVLPRSYQNDSACSNEKMKRLRQSLPIPEWNNLPDQDGNAASVPGRGGGGTLILDLTGMLVVTFRG